MRITPNILIMTILLVAYLSPVSAQTFDFTPQSPVLTGNTIIDHNNFTYSTTADGVYRIDYNDKSTYFGFALSGTVGITNFVKFTSDYTWTTTTFQSGNTIDASLKNNDSNWLTNFTFSPYSTKITNTLTNTLPVAITNAKFYYVFTINQGDIILYNNENYSIPSNPNIHLSGNLNNNIPSIKINNNLLFDFQDIITNGFDVTDIYLNSGTNLGVSYSGNVIAIGFTKNNGIFPAGATVVIDPTLTSGDFESGVGGWTFSEGAGTASFAVVNVSGDNMGRVSVTTYGINMQLMYTGLLLEPNTRYRLKFEANSTAGHNLNLYYAKFTSPYTNYGLSNFNYEINSTLSEHTVYFTTSGFSSNTTDTRLQFMINDASSGEKFYFNNVTLDYAPSIPPTPTSLANTSGNFWVNHTWSAGAGNTTNSYNVSVNGTWTNTSSNTYYNHSVLLPHDWSNITVYSYNSTGEGAIGSTAISENAQIPNNPITISNISDTYTADIGSTLSIYPTYSDDDSDIPTFGNTTTKGNFFTNNGTFIWTPQAGDNGTYNFQINVTDGYGSVDYKNFSISVNSTTPGQPLSLSSEQGNFWINNTWNTSVNIDTFNVSINNIWTNGSSNAYNNSTLSPHEYSNITVYGYNSSSDTLGISSSLSTQLSNNPPTFSNITLSDASITTSESTTISVNITDLDNDTMSNVTVGIIATSLGGSEVNYSMSQSFNTTVWTYSFSTLTPATYTINAFYVNDGYDNTSTTDTTIITVSTPASIVYSSSNSGSGLTVINDSNYLNKVLPILNLTYPTIRTSEQLKAIGDCLMTGPFISSNCANTATLMIKTPSSWWVYISAFIASLIITLVMSLIDHKPRNLFGDTLFYGIVTIFGMLILILLGFNLFFFSYLLNSNSPALISLSIGTFAVFVTLAGDEIQSKKRFRKSNRMVG